VTLPPLYVVGIDPVTGQRYRLLLGGDLEIDGETLLLGGPNSGSKRETVTFVQNGRIGTLTRLDGSPVMNRAGSIKAVRVFRQTAGSAGSTTVDVNVNGTTIFTDQLLRPEVTAAGGADQKVEADLTDAAVTFAPGDDLSVDVDIVETGGPKELTVTLEVQYD